MIEVTMFVVADWLFPGNKSARLALMTNEIVSYKCIMAQTAKDLNQIWRQSLDSNSQS